MSLRDEDISFPPSLNKLHQLTLKDILAQLAEYIDSQANSVGIKAHLKWMRSMLLVTLNSCAKDKLVKEVAPEEEEKVQKKKKGKANKKKGDDVDKKFDPQDIAGIIREMQESVEIIA